MALPEVLVVCAVVLVTVVRTTSSVTASCKPCSEYFQTSDGTAPTCVCLYNRVYSPTHAHVIADCHNLKAVPRFGEICNMSDVYSVQLQHNHITKIGKDAFHELQPSDAVINWAGVKPYILLYKNDIDTIDNDAFRGTMEAKLSYLDLKNNKLTTIPPAVYKLVNLTKLYLSHNKIETVVGDSRMSQLHELDLTSNKLTAFPRDVCKFPALGKLYLDGNEITEDLSDVLDDLVNCPNLMVLTWPQEHIRCNQTQLETYANTSSCKEMQIFTSGHQLVRCGASGSSPEYHKGVSLEQALRWELSKVCSGISGGVTVHFNLGVVIWGMVAMVMVLKG